MKKSSFWSNRLVYVYAVLWFVGDIMFAAFLLTGGDMLDGLFGIKDNAAWQDWLYLLSVFAIAIGALSSVVLSVVVSVKRYSQSKKYMLLIPASLVTPALAGIGILYVYSMLTIYF